MLQEGAKRRSKGPDESDVLKRPLGVFLVAIMKMKQWETDLGLPPASNSRDDALRMFVVAANYYWKNSANPTSTRDLKRQLEKSINNYRRAGACLSKLALGNVEELFLTGVIIDGLEKTRRDLLDVARCHDGAAFHRRQFIFDLLLIWVAYGNTSGQSTDPYSGERTGPLIRYLTFACRVVLGQSPADETLRDHIRDFKHTGWNLASRRPRNKK